MTVLRELRELKPPVQVFDLVDGFARQRRVQGPRPRPLEPIRFWAMRQVGAPQPFPEPLELVVQRNPSGYHLFFGVVQLPDGARRYGFLPPGTYEVRIQSPYHQTHEAQVDLPIPDPKAPTSFELLPGYAYPFPALSGYSATLLRGHVRGSDGRGVPGIRVEVVGQPISYRMTGDTGQWVLVFLGEQPSGTVTVRFTLDGVSLEREAPVEPGSTTVLPPVDWPE